MGSTSYYTNGRSVKECILSEINCENESGKWEVIDSYQKGGFAGAIYMAVKRTYSDGKSYIFGCVGKFYVNRGYITTKIMDESCGPYYYDCPNRILNKLSPTEKESEIKWRNKCRASNKAKLGCKFKISRPLKFSDGIERQRFQKLRRGRRVYYQCLDTGDLVNIRKISNFNLEIL